MLLTSVASLLKLQLHYRKVRKTRKLLDYDQERNTDTFYIYSTSRGKPCYNSQSTDYRASETLLHCKVFEAGWLAYSTTWSIHRSLNWVWVSCDCRVVEMCTSRGRLTSFRDGVFGGWRRQHARRSLSRPPKPVTTEYIVTRFATHCWTACVSSRSYTDSWVACVTSRPISDSSYPRRYDTIRYDSRV